MFLRIIPVIALSLRCTLLLNTQCTLSVQAFASSSPKRKKAVRAGKAGSGGFGSSGTNGRVNTKEERSANNEDADKHAKQTVRNLFSVCSHIQNPELYQPLWADACHMVQGSDGTISTVASKDVQKGAVLTLFPIHALGLRTLRKNNTKKKTKKKNRREDTEFVAYDLDRDGEYFQEENNQQAVGLRMKLNIPLEDGQPASSSILAKEGDRKNKVLFAMLFREDVAPGWLGGRVRSGTDEPNCVTLPLPGAAPLCAVVATKDVNEGDELVQGLKPPEVKVLEECKGIIATEYEAELSELQGYIEMACKTTATSATNNESTATEEKAGDTDNHLLGPFHQINQQYPGLTQLHRNPDIYQVDNFLSDDECDRIIAKATPHLAPCLIKNESTGAIERDPSRTSTDANLPRAEAPSIVSKLTDLARCRADQLEILQILRYTQGQEFQPHTDGYAGPVSACGFEESNRLVTVFCYLNDVARGGSTYFPEMDVEIRPKKGMAVVHFPSDTELREDERTLHQGMPAIDDKLLLATWVWTKPRSDPNYDEKKLASLSTDVI